MSQAIQVKIHKLHPDVPTPQRQSNEAAAYDVYAYLAEPVLLQPGQRAAIATGLKTEIPPGYFLTVRPRSGLALKHGITCLNAPGTIDSDYRGELMVILVNHGDKAYEIGKGERIAQLLLEKVIEIDWQEVKDSEQLSATGRGEGGFGSTGRS